MADDREQRSSQGTPCSVPGRSPWVLVHKCSQGYEVPLSRVSSRATFAKSSKFIVPRGQEHLGAMAKQGCRLWGGGRAGPPFSHPLPHSGVPVKGIAGSATILTTHCPAALGSHSDHLTQPRRGSRAAASTWTPSAQPHRPGRGRVRHQRLRWQSQGKAKLSEHL